MLCFVYSVVVIALGAYVLNCCVGLMVFFQYNGFSFPSMSLFSNLPSSGRLYVYKHQCLLLL